MNSKQKLLYAILVGISITGLVLAILDRPHGDFFTGMSITLSALVCLKLVSGTWKQLSPITRRLWLAALGLFVAAAAVHLLTWMRS